MAAIHAGAGVDPATVSCGTCRADRKFSRKRPVCKLAGTYPVKRGDGSTVRVTVPPRACQVCGGDGCKACNGTGDEPEGE